MALSSDELLKRGSKRVCYKCATRFYDLNKDPFECPKCHEVVSRDTKTPRKNRVMAATMAETFQDETTLEPLGEIEEEPLEEGVSSTDFETLEDPSDLGEEDGFSEVAPHLEKSED